MFLPYLSTFPESEERVYFSDHNATITTGFSVQSDIQTEIWNGFGRNSLVVSGQRVGTHTIKLPVAYIASSEAENPSEEVNDHIQHIEFCMLGKFTLNVGDGYMYQCAVTDKSSESWYGDKMCTRTYTISAVRTREAIAESFAFDGPITVNCASTVPKTDCRILLRSAPTVSKPLSVDQLTVGDLFYKVKDGLLFQWSGELIVDGIDKVITTAGDNVVSKFDWVDFPYLVPGENTISLDDDSYSKGIYCYVTYYQTYL